MTLLITIYIIVLLIVALYVAVNVFHIFRFSVKDKDDISMNVIFTYLAIVVFIITSSVAIGIIAYNF